MKTSDRVTSIVLIAFGISVCIVSVRIGLGTLRGPGTGFMPFIVAIFICLSALPTLLRPSSEKKLDVVSPQEKANFPKVMKVIVGLVVYILLLSRLGYVIGSFLLMLFFFKRVETVRWHWAVIAAILVVSASFFIFDVLLHCNLPAGLMDMRGLINWIF